MGLYVRFMKLSKSYKCIATYTPFYISDMESCEDNCSNQGLKNRFSF